MTKAESLDDETSKKVIRQVEFYFSDSNLPRDNFLKQTINETEDGMVSLALLCSFSRMRSHLGLLGDVKPEDVSPDTVQAVAETLRTSSFLKVSEDGKKVGRVTELAKPDEVIEQLDNRTIAASPLEYDVKLEGVESFFGQFGKVNSVRLPRHVNDRRLFCGTALVEFSSEEDAAKVLDKSLVYAGMDLELKPKKIFDEERAKQEMGRPQSHFGSNRKSNSVPEEDYPRGLIVAFKLKKISTEGATGQNGNHEPSAEDTSISKPDDTPQVDTLETEQALSANAENDQANNENVEGDDEKDEENDVVETGVEASDSVEKPNSDEKSEGKLTVASLKDNKDVILREDLKSVFKKFGTVKFVDFKMGSDAGYIRFEEARASQKARAAAVLVEEGGLIVKNFIATLDPVTGDAEKEYWSLLRSGQEKNRGNLKGNRGRGGSNRGWKHSRGRENDAGNRRPNKSQKVGV